MTPRQAIHHLQLAKQYCQVVVGLDDTDNPISAIITRHIAGLRKEEIVPTITGLHQMIAAIDIAIAGLEEAECQV